jgi:hypothetical protein
VIEITIVFNGDRKLQIHPPEERDVRLLDLMLRDVKTLSVTKVGNDYHLVPIDEKEKR